MIFSADVQYKGDTGHAAAVLFEHWADAQASQVITADVDHLPEYQAGQFYRRELPCLLALLESCQTPITCIIIDGYVTLEQEQTPGLGHKLWEALNGAVPVIGVAKTYFSGTPEYTKVYRNGSQTPLYITAAGLPLEQAKQHIQGMHGPYRLPTLLKQVDRLARGV